MFKLPKCPNCNTVYHYKDVKEALKKKDNTCYHCKEDFKAKFFPQGLVLILLVILCAVIFNILYLSSISKLGTVEMILMLVITIIFLVIGYFLIPFFAGFKKKDEKKK